MTNVATTTGIRVFSGAAPKTALQLLAADFEQATKYRIRFTFQLVSDIQRKLIDGEAADLILLPVPLISETEKSIPLRSEGRKVIAQVGIGVIVRNGTVPPDISSEEALRQALLDAHSIVLDSPITPNGKYLQRMMGQLGIAEIIAPKVIAKAPIEGGADLVANGDADLGMFLASEVQNVEGAALIGSLPSPLNNYAVFSSAIPTYNLEPESAIAFVEFISDPTSKDHWAVGGFEHLDN